MAMQVALSTLKTVGWNGLYAGGHFAGGFALAVTINKLAHYILKAQPQSALSFNIGFVATAIALTASLYFAPQAAVVAMTTKQALAVITVAVAARACVHWLDYKILHLICFGAYIAIAGAAAGVLGAPVLPIVGLLAATSGGFSDVLEPKKVKELWTPRRS